MRDPARIREFCNRLAAAWEKLPNYRFGEIIFVAIYNLTTKQGFNVCSAEDDVMITKLEAFIERLRTQLETDDEKLVIRWRNLQKSWHKKCGCAKQ